MAPHGFMRSCKNYDSYYFVMPKALQNLVRLSKALEGFISPLFGNFQSQSRQLLGLAVLSRECAIAHANQCNSCFTGYNVLCNFNAEDVSCNRSSVRSQMCVQPPYTQYVHRYNTVCVFLQKHAPEEKQLQANFCMLSLCHGNMFWNGVSTNN